MNLHQFLATLGADLYLFTMKTLLLPILFFIALFSVAQNQESEPISQEVKYYKKFLHKETSPSKAKFKVINSEYENNIHREEKIRLADNQTIYSRFYTNNKPTGLWHEFTERDGVIEVDYNQSIYCEEDNQATKKGEPLDSTNEYQGPIYNETKTDFYNVIAKSTRYPFYALDRGISGNVFMKFKVDTIGMVKDVCIIQGVHWSLDTEAYRVIHLLNRFNQAAIKNGEVEETILNVPIKFNLR